MVDLIVPRSENKQAATRHLRVETADIAVAADVLRDAKVCNTGALGDIA
jgi:hypothetical protein